VRAFESFGKQDFFRSKILGSSMCKCYMYLRRHDNLVELAWLHAFAARSEQPAPVSKTPDGRILIQCQRTFDRSRDQGVGQGGRRQATSLYSTPRHLMSGGILLNVAIRSRCQRSLFKGQGLSDRDLELCRADV
jgi:hypothetical protein